jgi:hypothetical protein
LYPQCIKFRTTNILKSIFNYSCKIARRRKNYRFSTREVFQTRFTNAHVWKSMSARRKYATSGRVRCIVPPSVCTQLLSWNLRAWAEISPLAAAAQFRRCSPTPTIESVLKSPSRCGAHSKPTFPSSPSLTEPYVAANPVACCPPGSPSTPLIHRPLLPPSSAHLHHNLPAPRGQRYLMQPRTSTAHGRCSKVCRHRCDKL